MELNIVDSIGYLAIIINLYSMSTKGEYKLRLISLIANVIFVFYGSLIQATPVIIGGSIAVCLHAYHIRRIYLKTARNA